LKRYKLNPKELEEGKNRARSIPPAELQTYYEENAGLPHYFSRVLGLTLTCILAIMCAFVVATDGPTAWTMAFAVGTTLALTGAIWFLDPVEFIRRNQYGFTLMIRCGRETAKDGHATFSYELTPDGGKRPGHEILFPYSNEPRGFLVYFPINRPQRWDGWAGAGHYTGRSRGIRVAEYKLDFQYPTNSEVRIQDKRGDRCWVTLDRLAPLLLSRDEHGGELSVASLLAQVPVNTPTENTERSKAIN
jgi:hypothetical protein